MSRIYLPENASRPQMKAAREAQKERREILKALSHRQVSRRDLIRAGLFTAGGLLAPIRGLNPFMPSLLAQTPGGPGIPTGLPPSPMNGVLAFTQAMPRFDVLPRKTMDTLTPAPTEEANQTRQPVDSALGGGWGPIEGRPPGPMWAHQNWSKYPAKVAVEVSQGCAATNYAYNPTVPSSLNSGISQTSPCALKFHPNLPAQDPRAVWTFNGTIPPKLMLGRYGEAILFRHHNRLPVDPTQNYGFGRHTISTHEHNGHHGAENDGFTGAFFFPNQYYDYHYPILLAGCTTMNTAATDKFASTPDDSGGYTKIAGDWHETMSTHWFHDHMFSFTAQNVYKGNAGMFNLYSGIDRGNESINDGVNLRLPSGSAKSWGNLDYDVNLMLADKSWDRDGQLAMDIFQFDGFLGDQMTVNLAYKPYFEVEARKYRFRILNASVSRFFKIALANSSGAAQPIIQIANDGNLLPRPITLSMLDQQGIAERYDIVIDFSKYALGTKLWMVNCCEHQDGKLPAHDLTLGAAMSGASHDPCVGRFLEFRIVRKPATADLSVVPPVLIPNPDLSAIPVACERTFEFNRGANQSSTLSSDIASTGPWGIATNGGGTLAADYARVSSAPKIGTREIWTLQNGGGGWDHPIHIHFEEGQIIDRDGSAANVPLWERGRKDVYRLRAAGSVKLTMQFRDFGGTYMEHCHNTVHEDNAMLLRWDVHPNGTAELNPLPTPVPTPQGVTFIDPDDVLT